MAYGHTGGCFGAVGGPHAQRYHQCPGHQEGGQRRLPDPTNRILHRRRVEGPDPGRPQGHLPVEAARPDLPDRAGGKSRKEAIEGEDDPRRLGGKDPEKLEDAAQKQGKERSHPCSRAGVPAKGVGEAVSGGQRASDASHLLAKRQVVVEGLDAVSVGQGDVEHAHNEGGPKDQPRRLEWIPGSCRRLLDAAILYFRWYGACTCPVI